ncbi:MAG: class I SAM-dependent methyltransferase [Desulfuromonadales bacterium]|nr:class I SAM-dependent methyltransferase [Desulfuromonadales bacterium]
MYDWWTVLWQNLTQPQLWPELLRKIRNRVDARRSHPDDLVELRALARPWQEILVELFGEDAVARAQADTTEFEALVRELQEKERACPVRLGGGAHTRLLYLLTRLGRPQVVVETGVAYGWSSASVLLGLAQNGCGRLYSSDLPYPKIPRAADYAGWVVPERLRRYWTLRLGPDRQNLPEMLRGLDRINLVHYDSDKSWHGRLWAARLLWPKLDAGGLFVADDIQDNRAFLEFCALQGVTALVTEYQGKYIGICRKPGAGSA